MDKEAFIRSTIPRMAQYTFPFITSVIGVQDARSGAHVGSGLRCMIRGKRAVVTALHVIENARDFSGGFAVSAGYGLPPFRVHGPIHYDRARDIAVYYLPTDFPAASSDADFWPESRIETAGDRLSTDYLFTHGFPGEKSKFFQIIKGVASKSLPYGVMQRLEQLPLDLQPFQFALDFDPANMKSPEGGGQSTDMFVHPGGMSGSPVWRLGLSGGTAAAWKPENSRIVGFLTEWRPDEKILVASLASELLSITP